MITINGVEYRNLEEQVRKNQSDIKNLSFPKLNIVGRVDDTSKLPIDITTDNIGDIYLVGLTNPYNFYILTGFREETDEPIWEDMGTFVSLEPGPEGPEGPEGQKGRRGVMVFSGEGQPSIVNPEITFAGYTVQEGDLYIDVRTKNLYRYGHYLDHLDYYLWVILGSIEGPRGKEGPRGPYGPSGIPGKDGPQGPKGDPGETYVIKDLLEKPEFLPIPPEKNSDAYLVGAQPPYMLYVWLTKGSGAWQACGLVDISMDLSQYATKEELTDLSKKVKEITPNLEASLESPYLDTLGINGVAYKAVYLTNLDNSIEEVDGKLSLVTNYRIGGGSDQSTYPCPLPDYSIVKPIPQPATTLPTLKGIDINGTGYRFPTGGGAGDVNDRLNALESKFNENGQALEAVKAINDGSNTDIETSLSTLNSAITDKPTVKAYTPVGSETELKGLSIDSVNYRLPQGGGSGGSVDAGDLITLMEGSKDVIVDLNEDATKVSVKLDEGYKKSVASQAALDTTNSNLNTLETAVGQHTISIDNLKTGKQDKLSQVDLDNIASLNTTKDIVSQNQLDIATLNSNKQEKLTAGNNITISEDNVISATGSGGGGTTVTVNPEVTPESGVLESLGIDGTTYKLSYLTYLDNSVEDVEGVPNLVTTYRIADGSEITTAPCPLPTGGGGSYTLPAATASTLGGIKVGTGLSITSDGTLSASGGGGSSQFAVDDRNNLYSTYGTPAIVYGKSSNENVIIGNKAKVGNKYSSSVNSIRNIVIGQSASAGASQGVAIGNEAISNQAYSIAIGEHSKADSWCGISIGAYNGSHGYSNHLGNATILIGNNLELEREGDIPTKIILGAYNDTTSKSRFIIANGTGNDVSTRSNLFEITDNCELIMKSPNGTKYKVLVSDIGELLVEPA